MRTKAQHLKAIEEAYKAQGEVSRTVGLYLTEPFAGTEDSAKLASEVYQTSMKVEEMLRSLYQMENAVERP